MAEEKLHGFPELVKQGHSLDPGPFTLDLYRLTCMVLADREVAKHTLKSDSFKTLQGTYLRSEVARILISCAIGLRIRSDQAWNLDLDTIERWSDCGKLYPDWPAPENTFDVLKLREACNKIIHATDIRFDEVIPDASTNPDQEGVYLQPFLYLYGKKDRHDWRAVLSIIDFVKWGTAAFQA